MITALGTTGTGDPLLLLGLSGENMARLMAGEPIRINTREFNLPPIQIALVGGRDENTIVASLKEHGLIT